MPKQAQDFFNILFCNVVVVTLKSFDADIVFYSLAYAFVYIR